MIDVHCLVHTKKITSFEEILMKQLSLESDIKLHIIKNGSNIGLGRVTGFLSGTAPYVSYVDYDDMIEPGIFTEINEVMSNGVPWCFTDEMLIDENGEFLKPGWSSSPELYNESILGYVRIKPGVYAHHILTFRRDLITPKMCFIMKQLSELSEEYLRTELAQYHFEHIKKVGYYWRQHKDSTMLKYESYKWGEENYRND